MINDRQITITVGASRNAVDWLPQTMWISELWERLRTPQRGTETVAEYLEMPKGEQDKRKDVGGFVAGTLNGVRRKASAVTGRDIIALDLDNIPNGQADRVSASIGALGCGYCIYSTRKHRPDAPRLRVLFPLDRTCTADEYEPLARKMAEQIGMELADPTTFEAARLMYWPSCCRDGEYIYYTDDKPLLSVDGLLATYIDWRDVTSWPKHPGATPKARLAAKQGDPEEKKGIDVYKRQSGAWRKRYCTNESQYLWQGWKKPSEKKHSRKLLKGCGPRPLVSPPLRRRVTNGGRTARRRVHSGW